MDLSELSQAEKTVIGGAVILLIGSFQPWYQVGGLGISAWRTGFGSLGTLVALGGAAVVILKAFELRDLGRGETGAERLALMLIGVGAALMVLQFLSASAFVARGLYITLAGTAIAAYGARETMGQRSGRRSEGPGQIPQGGP